MTMRLRPNPAIPGGYEDTQRRINAGALRGQDLEDLLVFVWEQERLDRDERRIDMAVRLCKED